MMEQASLDYIRREILGYKDAETWEEWREPEEDYLREVLATSSGCLTEKERRYIDARMKGIVYREIAAEEGCSTENIRRQVERAYKRTRRGWRDWWFAHSTEDAQGFREYRRGDR